MAQKRLDKLTNSQTNKLTAEHYTPAAHAHARGNKTTNMHVAINRILFSFTEGSDYRFSEVSTNNIPAEWRLDIQDDDIALEYDDQLNLTYSPRPSNVIDRFEADGQFVRSTVAVYIEDNDGKPNMLAIMFCINKSIQ